jgi:hypothetical protein
LLVSELTGVFAKKAMKTAEGKNPNRWATMPGNRAHGAEGQNRSCSIKWAEKAENFSRGGVFFLTFPFREHFHFAQTGHSHFAATRGDCSLTGDLVWRSL